MSFRSPSIIEKYILGPNGPLILMSTFQPCILFVGSSLEIHVSAGNIFFSLYSSHAGRKNGENDKNYDTLDLPKRTEPSKGTSFPGK